MQRRAYGPVAVLAAALLSGVAGCTGSSGGDEAEDSKPGGPSSSAPAAEPGKYRSLPEACGSVGRGTLRDLLPGLVEEGQEESEREKAYDGEAALTYDTDRRAGCRWTAESAAGTRHLDIDFERVVSYDADLSDEDRAQKLYDAKAEEADIPAPDAGDGTGQPGGGDGEEPGSGEPSASASEEEAEGADEAESTGPGDGAESGTADEPGRGDSGSGSDSDKQNEGEKDEKGGKGGKGEKDDADKESPSADASADPDIAPRPLDELGDVAYIDDRLVTADSGLHRDIALVFRTSNVIVTIRYDQWSTDRSAIPDSEELQRNAQRLARELSERFDD
ncbi:hypothetical protein [Streptomyces sp. NPDC048845]|uniref:hypothetical protein n=1 Tax=Streptomyces sp. NPDC048845 TaxID=3155390 RepID=UPI00341FEE3A